jgi:transposase InsO family protein
MPASFPGSSSSSGAALTPVGTPGTYPKVTVDNYGRVTGGANLSETDIPTLAQAKIVGLNADLDKKKAIEPEYYYVIPVAGQSNTCFGEGQALPDTFDAEHPRIKQLARRTNTKRVGVTGNRACNFNDIIPLDWCPHGVEDLTTTDRSHGAAFAADNRQYGAISFALSMAKRLLPSLPDNAGILIVPVTRGGSAFTIGTDQVYSTATGAPSTSTRWGVTGGLAANGGKTALYLDLRDRTKAALAKNPKNVLLGVVWMQGEFDQSGTPANHKSMFEAMVNDFRTEINASNRSQCLGLDATKVPWLCSDSVKYFQDLANFTTVYEGTYKNSSLSNVHYIRVGKDEQGNWTPSNIPTEDPDVVVGGATIYFGSASRDSSNWLSSARGSHFSSWAHRTIIAERMAAAIGQTTSRLLPGVVSPEAGGTPRNYVQKVSTSASNIVVDSRNDITGETASVTIPLPSASVVNYAPKLLTIGYNSRRGNGTMLSQGFTGSLEMAAGTTTIAGATVIDGLAATNPNTLTSAINHPDGLGGFTYRHEAAAGSGEWYKKASVSISDLANLITYGGYVNLRMKIYSTFASQFAAALLAVANDSNPLLPAGTLTGIQGTDNDRLALLGHFIQLKLNGAVNSIYLSAWQNPTNVDLVSIPFDNNYHDYRLTFAGGGASVVASIDSTVGTARGLHYTAASNPDYISNAVGDTSLNMAITDITGGDTADFNMDQLQFVVYLDNGNITVSNVNANHGISLQANTRNHTITIPDFAFDAGKSIEITAANTGNVIVKGANSNVLIQPLGGSTALPSQVTIARASGAAIATYKFTQVGADGKTWVRTA